MQEKDDYGEARRTMHREWLANTFTELGPIKTLEALRTLRNASDVSLEEVRQDLIRRRVIDDSVRLGRQFSDIVVGYAADQAEWDEILGMIERKP